jgi:hypothetical protein
VKIAALFRLLMNAVGQGETKTLGLGLADKQSDTVTALMRPCEETDPRFPKRSGR